MAHQFVNTVAQTHPKHLSARQMLLQPAAFWGLTEQNESWHLGGEVAAVGITKCHLSVYTPVVGLGHWGFHSPHLFKVAYQRKCGQTYMGMFKTWQSTTLCVLLVFLWTTRRFIYDLSGCFCHCWDSVWSPQAVNQQPLWQQRSPSMRGPYILGECKNGRMQWSHSAAIFQSINVTFLWKTYPLTLSTSCFYLVFPQSIGNLPL